MKKTVALILIAVFVFSVFASFTACGNNNSQGGNNSAPDASGGTTGSQDAAESNAPATTELTDNIPKLDFGGYEMKILNTTQADLFYMNLLMEPPASEQTGDIINDAAYKRSLDIQERFNCKIKEIDVANGSRGGMFKKSALAGDNAYDIACIAYNEALDAASSNFIYNINDLSYVNLKAPWWDQNAKGSLSVMGKVFFCPGAYELSNFDMTRIILFNKKLMQDYNVTDNVYQLVKDGKWTQDKFFGMAKLISGDLNGDGKYDYNDMFGVGSTADHVVYGAFMHGSGEMAVKKDAADTPYFAAGSDRFNSIFTNMVDNFYQGNFYFYPKNVPAAEDWCTNMFNENRLLFYVITFNRIPKFRNMDADFGILPPPKFDEAQDRYYCESGSGMLAVIPQSAVNPDNNGAFLEAYAFYGYKYVVPQYKEVSLKTKLSRDSDSAAMVDIIDVSRVYDLGKLYWSADGFDPYVTLFGSKKTDVASVTEKYKPKVEADIAKALNVFK